jgi:RND family efflux transporter MFP subunit
VTKKKVITALSAFALLLVTLLWIQGAFHHKVPPGNVELPKIEHGSIKTVKAEKIESAGDITVSGTLVARETARIASRILGYIIELNVDAGSKVTEGQVLLRIDTKEMKERLAQSEAAWESARADLVKARNDYERYKGLYDKESVSKKDLDDFTARYETAQAAENRTKAAVDEARTLLSYGTVTSPFDGIVLEKLVNVGDLASPGKPLLSVFKPGTLELVAAVGEQYAPYLREGSQVTVQVTSAGVNEAARIREVVPQTDEKTRTITVKAPVKDKDGLVPGLYGTLTFGTRSSPVIVVPRAAVRVVGQLETVKVLVNGRETIRQVKAGRLLEGGMLEILSGVNPSEEIVLE